MRYCRVENGLVTNVYTGNLGWLDNNGDPLTDEDYIRDHSIYPMVEEHAGDDAYIESDKTNWTVTTVNVIVDYFDLINPNTVSYRISTSVTMNDESQWIWDVAERTCTITYTIKSRTDEEIQDIIDTTPTKPDEDYETHLEKPQNEWLYDGAIVEKTYYNIIPDPNRETKSEIFYDIERTDSAGWVITGDDVQEVCTFTYKTDIQKVKDDMKKDFADSRWKIEVGSMYYDNGTDIDIFHTDRASQMKFTAKYMYITTGDVTEEYIEWKTIRGFINMVPDVFKEVCKKVENFVALSYKAESAVYNEMETINDIAGLETIHNEKWARLAVEDSVFLAEM